jgi:uncharacterized cupin superfamily protein
LNLFDDAPGKAVELARAGGTLYELPPGQASPYHWHYGEEELCLVVTGRPTLRTPSGERQLRQWDVAWFPRGPAGAHSLRNDGDEPARILFFSTLSDPEVAVYPDSERAAVKAGDMRGWVEPR